MIFAEPKKTNLEIIKEDYQTDAINAVCPACIRQINDHIYKIMRLNNKLEKSFTKQFMENLKRTFQKKIGE